jgi:hypothetical protein
LPPPPPPPLVDSQNPESLSPRKLANSTPLLSVDKKSSSTKG